MYLGRYLQPENILLDNLGNIKLNDFGFSKELKEDGEKAQSFAGSIDYMAPEIALDKGHDFRADFWSLGAVMYEMLTGVIPLYSKNKADMIRKRLDQVISKQRELSETAYDLLIRLLEKDVSHVPTIQHHSRNAASRPSRRSRHTPTSPASTGTRPRGSSSRRPSSSTTPNTPSRRTSSCRRALRRRATT